MTVYAAPDTTVRNSSGEAYTNSLGETLYLGSPSLNPMTTAPSGKFIYTTTPVAVNAEIPDIIAWTGQYSLKTEVGGPNWQVGDLLHARLKDFDDQGVEASIYDIIGIVTAIPSEGNFDIMLLGTAADYKAFEEYGEYMELVKQGETNRPVERGYMTHSTDDWNEDAHYPHFSIFKYADNISGIDAVENLINRSGNLFACVTDGDGENDPVFQGWYEEDGAWAGDKLGFFNTGHFFTGSLDESSYLMYDPDTKELKFKGDIVDFNTSEFNITAFNDDENWGSRLAITEEQIATNVSNISANADDIFSNATDIIENAEKIALKANITYVDSELLGKNTMTRSATAPSDPITGDLWIDTSSNNDMKTWDGTDWVEFNDWGSFDASLTVSATEINSTVSEVYPDGTGSSSAITLNADQIAQNVSNISANADNISSNSTGISENADAIELKANITYVDSGLGTKNKVTKSSTEPTDPIVGDVWINTNNNDNMLIWTGTLWNTFNDWGSFDASLTVSATEINSTVSEVYPDGTGSSSAIVQNADNINQRVEKNDVINQINISTEGILLDADKIQIDGTTTFSTGYDPTEKETPAGAQTKASQAQTNAINYSDAALSNFSDTLGDLATEDMVELAKLGTTVVSGGYILTSLINATAVVAAVANITHTLTIGNASTSGTIQSYGFVSGSTGWQISKSGFEVNNGDINGGTITGATVQTGTNGQRVVMDSSKLTFWDSSNNDIDLYGYDDAIYTPGEIVAALGLYTDADMQSSGIILGLAEDSQSKPVYFSKGDTDNTITLVNLHATDTEVNLVVPGDIQGEHKAADGTVGDTVTINYYDPIDQSNKTATFKNGLITP